MKPFIEDSSRHSPFISFSEAKVASSTIPNLSYLRVELDRVRPGMSDYIIRVATPEGSPISIRGNRFLAKYAELQKLAAAIREEMLNRKDSSHEWEQLDVEHLTDMLYPQFKFFSQTMNTDRLQFTTEALV